MADQDLDARLSDTKEEEARETAQCACEQDGRTPEAKADDNAPVSLSDEEIAKVVGGAEANSEQEPKVDDMVKVRGGLYSSCDGEEYLGQVNGLYFIQQYISGRDKPYLLYNNEGWVEASAVRPLR